MTIEYEIKGNFKFYASKNGKKIRKVGTDEIYDEAYDLLTSEYEYEETDELVTPKETTE